MQFTIRFFLLIVLLLFTTALAAQEILPLSEVKPGQTGVARTVFSGNTIEEFGIKVVDVLQNFFPKRNLIIVELTGPKAELVGPARGMSGSPVYIDGKLAGALAYGLASFLKTPLMGVTPIEEMLEIFDRESQRDNELAAYAMDDHGKFIEMALGLREASWENFLSAASLMTEGNVRKLDVQPIALPLIFSGFLPSVLADIAPALKPLGFEATIGGSAMSSSGVDDLQPGSAVGGVLVAGDAGIEAVGTVTYRRGNQVLAFGHPFFGNGPINLPMSSARVLATLPSLEFSNKLAVGTGIIGALRQDRMTGIYGTIGDVAPMPPVIVRYENEGGIASQFNFSFAEEKSLATLMPLFVRVTLIEALQSARLATGENSLRVQGVIRLHSAVNKPAEEVEIPIDNFYSGVEIFSGMAFLNSILQSTGDIAAMLGAVMANKFQPVGVKEVSLKFSSFAGRRAATLEQVWLDRSSVAPGDSLTVFARLRRHQGGSQQIEQRIAVPRDIGAGPLSVVVGSSDELTRLEARGNPIRFQPQSLNHLIELLKRRRRNDVLNIQLRQSDRGVIIDGEEMPSLPPSIYTVMQPPNARGKTSVTRERTLAEVTRSLSFVVSGLTTVKLSVQQKVSRAQ